MPLPVRLSRNPKAGNSADPGSSFFLACDAMKPDPLPGCVWLDTPGKVLHVEASRLEFRNGPPIDYEHGLDRSSPPGPGVPCASATSDGSGNGNGGGSGGNGMAMAMTGTATATATEVAKRANVRPLILLPGPD
jgi:hypothetical protein